LGEPRRSRRGGVGTREGLGWWATYAQRPSSIVGGVIVLGVVLTVVLGPLISPEQYSGFDFRNGGLRPQLDWRYLLGSDVYGHSILADILLGARTTVGIAALAAGIALAVGGMLGVTLDLPRQPLPSIALAALEIGLSIPFLPLALVLLVLVGGRNGWTMGLILGLLAAIRTAVLVRRSVTRILSGDAVRAARASGAGPRLILRRYIFPALTPDIIVCGTWLLGAMILTEATVDFLGLGLSPSTVSWGTALGTTTDYAQSGEWWWLFFPGLAIFITVLGVNLTGRGLVRTCAAPRRGKTATISPTVSGSSIPAGETERREPS